MLGGLNPSIARLPINRLFQVLNPRRILVKQALITRRTFLTSAAGAAVVVALPHCSPATRRREMDRRSLFRVARLLYPHDALGDEIYTDVLQPLLARADRDVTLAGDLRAGVAMLDAGAGGNWLAASPERQLEALERLEGGVFFETMQTAVRTRLYQHPAVWNLIGYEGSSVEYGGYIHRGFDDIDWLPEDSSWPSGSI